ncbi:MAG: hypothetical protein JGK17_22905 [Microcoleus sp. PH2017_10_PVI_O_A]|uniref:hypothetical protein n=1 Tax=unclassified Microcoleus TaxID=2642155 RepID=UPI001D342C00|nr:MULTISPECIES: hypothetical protein [unclassified Microcoleus]TAE79094.1 MAG: hypothetical protein EAZ83_22750 [Oscillatoriales cyanobacterium]MCC3408381.1 hypothetical protein [Microcoleus sp. PH2017_10_PVI_O_A]MCC3462441.1 hypothetical protein [Microcoleus sp. PH2017_11_PCY_U_A]MCC3480920.1 hypothetical protein [Microcoleus sp. PH2017_12_PCY_D_A]MCC3530924.1 hypothetical protein [Microcoleus sp. PH2017_21_RUC_O_A]
MLATFSRTLNLSPDASEALLSLPLTSLLDSPELDRVLGSLDTALLKETLPTAGAVLSQKLPAFYDWLQTELGLQNVPDSPDYATKWVVGFLKNQESLTHLVEMHKSIPRLALERSIPRLVSAFDEVQPTAVKEEWEKAIAALCLILAAAARENQPAGASKALVGV